MQSALVGVMACLQGALFIAVLQPSAASLLR